MNDDGTPQAADIAVAAFDAVTAAWDVAGGAPSAAEIAAGEAAALETMQRQRSRDQLFRTA